MSKMQGRKYLNVSWVILEGISSIWEEKVRRFTVKANDHFEQDFCFILCLSTEPATAPSGLPEGQAEG